MFTDLHEIGEMFDRLSVFDRSAGAFRVRREAGARFTTDETTLAARAKARTRAHQRRTHYERNRDRKRVLRAAARQEALCCG